MRRPYEYRMLKHCLSMMPEQCLSYALRNGRTHVTTTHLDKQSHLAYRAQGGSKK